MRAWCLIATFALPIATAAQQPRIRDSVGIRIVENPSLRKAPVVFTLAAKPSVDIGGLNDDPDKELNAKNPYPRVVRLLNGNIAVSDRSRVLLYDAGGKFIRSTGRNGGGPGEFGVVSALCRSRGDTILVSDEQHRRVSVLTPMGEYRRVFLLPGGNVAEREFCLSDGTLIGNGNYGRNANNENTLSIVRVDRTGALSNTVANVNTGVFDMAVRRESRIHGWGANVVFGNATDYELQVFSGAGKLVSLIRTDDDPEPVSRSELEKLPPMATRANATEAERRDAVRRMLAASHTKTWPTHDLLMTDIAGRLWLQDWKKSPSALEPDTWTAFDNTGKLIGKLTIPAADTKERRQLVVHFGKDEVFIRRHDDDGALHYLAYPIVLKK